MAKGSERTPRSSGTTTAPCPATPSRGIPRLSRRGFIKSAGAAALGLTAVAAAPGVVRWSGAAPAQLRGTSVSILEATYFIPAAQDLFKKQAQDWGQANGVTVNVDFLNWPDLQPKIAAAIQAGGYDIVELWPGWNHLYADNLVDLTDLAETVAKQGGGWEGFVLEASSRLSLTRDLSASGSLCGRTENDRSNLGCKTTARWRRGRLLRLDKPRRSPG